MTDHTPELFELFDKAGLTPSDLLTKHYSMQKIVTDIRTKLVASLNDYVNKIEEKTDAETRI